MTAKPKSKRGMPLLAQWIFLAVFLSLGTGLMHEGNRAIHDQHYFVNYSQRQIGATSRMRPSESDMRSAEYVGAEATLLGVGFVAGGTMSFAWAAGLGLGLLYRAPRKTPRPLVMTLGAISLAALAVGCIALFPPWRLHTVPLYLVVAAFFMAVALPLPARVRMAVFPAYAGVAILACKTPIPAAPIFAGFFVFVFIGANLVVLWPELAKRIGGTPGSHGRRRDGHKVSQ